MDIIIPAKTAKARHKLECQAFLDYLRKSKTKSKDTPEENFVYLYLWTELYKGDSWDDIVSGKAFARDLKDRKKSVEDKIKESIDRSSAALIIRAGKVKKFYPISGFEWSSDGGKPGIPLPNEVIKEIKKREVRR